MRTTPAHIIGGAPWPWRRRESEKAGGTACTVTIVLQGQRFSRPTRPIPG
jgi:hypothetical protein